MEEENINTPAQEQTPKKRGRKPKSEISASENSAPKKRGRPRKAEVVDEQQTTEQNTQTDEQQTRKVSLDEMLDSAVKQRRARGRPSSKIPREDGPAWRDTPAVSQESDTQTGETDGESESEIFVHHGKSDDFEFTKTSDGDNSFQEDNDDDDDIPTSFSTTDDDLDPDAYRNNFDNDDSEKDDDQRIAEAREYENAVDDDDDSQSPQEAQQHDRQNDRQQRWQKRDRNNKFDKRDRQNNNNRNQNQQRQQGQNNRQDFRNKNNRNQNQQQNNRNQNNQRQQQQQKQQQRQNQQKKSRWNQNQNSEEEFINPADLPEWNSFKNEVALNERLAQIFFGKTPSWELETFESATPIALDGTPIEQSTDSSQEQAQLSEQKDEENIEQPTQENVEVAEEQETQTTEENPDLEIPQKAVSDMNYWELMANANDSAVKKLGLEKGLIEKEKVEESAQEQSSQPEQNKVQPEEKSDFQEPTSLIVSDCGEVESLDGFDDIYKLSAREIQQKYDELGIEYKRGIAKSDLVLEYFKYALSQKKLVKVSGVLDVFQDNLGGAITFECDNYRLKKCSVYVPQLFIDKYALKRGHTVSAFAMPPREYGRENCPFAVAITSVMNGSADDAKNITPFTDLVPYYPTRRIILESPSASRTDSLPMRAVDLLTPIGFGQRALIVAPPRTGKTVLMQGMAKSIRMNAPDAHLMILLVDERPEEVTDFKRNVDAEVIASTFDEEAGNHVHAAEMVISRARRMVEAGKDVIILLDSITRLARAYNALMPNGGRTMSGGVEANALQKPKKFFSSARNIEDGGSLTIIGTALIETGSKMDEVIFEEFKGTGNLELHLDRALSDKRIFPAINIEKSGTRKEELLYHPDEMAKIYALRRAMKGVPTTDAMEMLVQRLKKTRSNIEFLLAMNY